MSDTAFADAMDRACTPDQYAPMSVDSNTIRDKPDAYRENLIRLMSMQAYAERLGVLELSRWVERAPDFRYRRIFANIASDEANHAHWLYRELESLGVSEADAVAIAEEREGKGGMGASMAGPKAVADTDNSWIDVVLNTMFLDRAGRFMVTNFSLSSYAPWARIARRILKDERMHEGFGLRELRKALIQYDDREDLARRVTKWYSLGLNFFGPPHSSRAELLRGFGLKRLNNEQLRTYYIDECETILDRLGAKDLVRLETGAFPYA